MDTVSKVIIYAGYYCPRDCLKTYQQTEDAFAANVPVIKTTQIHFLRFYSDRRLFINKNNKTIEIKIGGNNFTDRILNYGHNLEKLFLAGEFDDAFK